MPHGAGHVGGGGGGFAGGGFHGVDFHGGDFHHHGGSFRHHRFDRHHHHYRGGGWWWWGGPRYYHGSPGYYAYRRIWGCACFWISLVVVLVFALTTIGALVGTGSKSSKRQYTPGDTRLVSVDSSFCSGASVSGTNSVLEATFYALSRPPALTSWNNFTLNESSVSVPFSGYVNYQFYLHKGSAANVRSCLAGSLVSSLRLLIIKGTSNFNSWVKRPSTSRALHSYTISQTCPGSDTFDFQSTGDDYYFFVYYNTARSTSARVSVWLQFYRTQYTVNPSDVLSSCQYDGVGSCSISTTSGATYLLVVSNDRPHSQDGDFSVRCIANGGMIAVIVLIPLLVLALLVAVIIVVACYCRYKHSKKAAASAPPTTASATDPMLQPAQPEAPGTATVVNATITAPPAYSTSYPAAPPPYSTVTPSHGTGEKVAGI